MAKTRKNYSLTRELATTRVVMMEGSALNYFRSKLLHNFNAHTSAEDILDDILPSERHYMLTYNKDTHEVTRLQFFNEQNVLVEMVPASSFSATVSEASAYEEIEVPAAAPAENEQRILFLELTGPVTRCGGMCSYGSMDMRDIMLEYADDESVVGMVLITDTPGGSAFALHDFAQGMEAWRAAGKRSIQWIDGMSCSAGVACGCQCEKIIAMNRKDTVGCIGAMMAGFMIADGTVDQNGVRYVDITATQTPDKNGEFRAAAAGDYDALQKEVDSCCEDFLATIERCRPQINPDQRTGHTYDAGDVIGSLVDGIGTLDMAIHYCLTGEETWSTASASIVAPVSGDASPELICPNPDHDPDCDPDEDPDHDPDETATVPSASAEVNDNANTETIMTQIEAERIAAKMGITPEEVMAIATTEEIVEQPAAPAAEETVETPAEPVAPVTPESVCDPEKKNEEDPEDACDPDKKCDNEETVETPAVEEPAAPATDESTTPAEPAEPAATVPSASADGSEPAAPATEETVETPAEEAAAPADPTLALLQQMQQQMAAMQQQMQSMQQQNEETSQALATANAQLATAQQAAAAAQKEAQTLRNAAPAPAMPAAPAHAPSASTSATRIHEGMSAKEKLEAYKKRGEQLKRTR